jgi:hypothetical protein
MPTNAYQVIQQGGQPLVRLLQFSVMAVRMDPVFLYLIRDYRATPTAARAVMMYDLFCHERSPGRLSIQSGIPPFDLRLTSTVETIRQSMVASKQSVAEDPEDAVPPLLPGAHFFDSLSPLLLGGAQIRAVNDELDPERPPVESLPDGRMNEGQRQFVENIWKPGIRPHLVSVGFRGLAPIG